MTTLDPNPGKARTRADERPAKLPEKKETDSDQAVAGRDRLQGNEERPMSPGIPDSAHG